MRGRRESSNEFVGTESVENMSDILERVQMLTARQLDVERERGVESASFIGDLGADSLDMVELLMDFEDEFGIEIPDDMWEKFATVGDVVRYLETALAETK